MREVLNKIDTYVIEWIACKHVRNNDDLFNMFAPFNEDKVLKIVAEGFYNVTVPRSEDFHPKE